MIANLLVLTASLAVLDDDGVVRVSDPSGRVSSAKVHFELPVAGSWKTVRRFRDWGFKLVKIDYLTYDFCGHFKGVDADGRLIRDDRVWKVRTRTTAETMVGLYLADADVRAKITEAFTRASVPQSTAEPVGWEHDPTPEHWKTMAGDMVYDWQ